MKNLSIALFFFSSLIFGTNAFAKTNKKAAKRTTTTITKRTVKNVHPNRKIVKVKATKIQKPVTKLKNGKRLYKPTREKQIHKTSKRRTKYNYRSAPYIIGRSYSRLPRQSIRIVRHGRVEFYSAGTYFRPIFKRGRTNYLVVY